MFPRDNFRKTFTVMHYLVFEHIDTLSIAFLVCIMLYIDGKQFRCSVFTFVQYMSIAEVGTNMSAFTVQHARVKNCDINFANTSQSPFFFSFFF